MANSKFAMTFISNILVNILIVLEPDFVDESGIFFPHFKFLHEFFTILGK